LSHEADLLLIEEILGQLPGVGEVTGTVAGKRIRVAYDQTCIDFKSLLRRMDEVGYPAAR
jgi:copper chaperone CopZ